jgi:hypothetical protein
MPANSNCALELSKDLNYFSFPYQYDRELERLHDTHALSVTKVGAFTSAVKMEELSLWLQYNKVFDCALLRRDMK